MENFRKSEVAQDFDPCKPNFLRQEILKMAFFFSMEWSDSVYFQKHWSSSGQCPFGKKTQNYIHKHQWNKRIEANTESIGLVKSAYISNPFGYCIHPDKLDLHLSQDVQGVKRRTWLTSHALTLSS